MDERQPNASVRTARSVASLESCPENEHHYCHEQHHADGRSAVSGSRPLVGFIQHTREIRPPREDKFKVVLKPLTDPLDGVTVSVTDISITDTDPMNSKLLDPEDLLPLTAAVFHVLLALASEDRHGYSIMQHVAETTGGQIKMGPGTLYGTIKRLLGAGMIEESDERPDPKL